MRNSAQRNLVMACALALAAAPVAAQTSGIEQIPAPADPAAIPLGTGGVTGTRAPESWFRIGGQATVRNVATATLTPVLPARGKATGAAVIVAPGGGFLELSMDNEGWPVAHWLADHGIAAFVLKYRLTPTPPDMPGFFRQMGAVMVGAMRKDAPTNIAPPADALADGEAALALVHRRAAEWGVDSHRIGMVGFSAGAITTLGIALTATPDAMPAFIAPIYGLMGAVTVPADAPPMFNALAADDPLFAKRGLGLIEAWQQAGKSVEFHLYAKGGHGFGMGKLGTTTTGWIDDFYRWLDASGFLKAKR